MNTPRLHELPAGPGMWACLTENGAVLAVAHQDTRPAPVDGGEWNAIVEDVLFYGANTPWVVQANAQLRAARFTIAISEARIA